jgi:hypothetical protein
MSSGLDEALGTSFFHRRPMPAILREGLDVFPRIFDNKVT